MTALARLVLPMPPPPRIATLGEAWLRVFIISANSNSRPWNILCFEGSKQNDVELELKKGISVGRSRASFHTYFANHCFPGIPNGKFNSIVVNQRF